MSKSQQNLLNNFNSNANQFKDLTQIYNNPVLLSQLMSANKDANQKEQFQIDDAVNPIKSNGMNDNALSSLMLGPVFEYQQEMIIKQQNEIESLKSSYNQLLCKYNEMGIEFEECKRNLKLKVFF